MALSSEIGVHRGFEKMGVEGTNVNSCRIRTCEGYVMSTSFLGMYSKFSNLFLLKLTNLSLPNLTYFC